MEKADAPPGYRLLSKELLMSRCNRNLDIVLQYLCYDFSSASAVSILFENSSASCSIGTRSAKIINLNLYAE